MKLDPEIRKKSTDPEQTLDIVIVLTDASAIDTISGLKELEVKKVIRFINAIAGRMKIKDALALSSNPAVESIELDREASITTLSSPRRFYQHEKSRT